MYKDSESKKVSCWTYDDIVADCKALTDGKQPICVKEVEVEQTQFGDAFKNVIEADVGNMGQK